MFGSAILDVVIGVIFVYFIFSLLCSVINEWIARLFTLRAKTLKRGIEHLLADPSGKALAKSFHQHPLIKGTRKKASYPNYISSSTFALALMDLVMHFSQGGIEVPTVKQQVELEGNEPFTLSATQQRLLEALMQGQKSPILLQANIEKWFNDSMERVSGWYKRQTQIILLVTAVFVVVGFNVDTLKIAEELNRNSALRESLVKRAQAMIEKANSPKDIQIKDEISGLNVPLGWAGTSKISMQNIIGLLLSVLALSLGAPFWFDILNKLVNLRQTGTPPDENSRIVAQ